MTYTLRFEEDGLGVEKRIEFDADTPAQALLIAQGEAEGRWAELSVDGKPICRLGRERVGVSNYWVIRSNSTHADRPQSGFDASPRASESLAAGTDRP